MFHEKINFGFARYNLSITDINLNIIFQSFADAETNSTKILQICLRVNSLI